MLDILRIILSPFVFVYAAVVHLRNLFFDKKIFKAVNAGSKIISVGNLTVGGSGKTPTVIYVTNLLKSYGRKTGILSRGYGRKSSGYILVSDGSGIKVPIEMCGDEMYLLSDETNVPCAVSERRASGVEKFLKDVPLDVIVLDDAFQHRWIHRDLNILVVDQRFLGKTGRVEQNMLPLGLMREPFEAIERADVVIINRKFSDKEEIPGRLQKYFKGKKIFTAHYSVSGIYDLKTHHHYKMEDFQGQKSLVVCGIARPYSFLSILEQNNINIENKLIFTDHKDYSLKEVQKIRKKFYETNAYSVLTTQKDAVKLIYFSKELDDIDIYYLKIELKLDNPGEFEEVLKRIH